MSKTIIPVIGQKRYIIARNIALILSFLVTAMFSFLSFIISASNTESTTMIIFISLIVFFSSYHFFMRKYRRRKRILATPFPETWEKILTNKIRYYSCLNEEQKKIFQKEIQVFLAEKTITGINTDIDDKCRVLIASSAIIPIFKFPEWEYDKISEIIVYLSNFDMNFNYSSKDANIQGMVGIGHTMVLSKDSLISGFSNMVDKQNVGIHEFIHKIDETDGLIDGIPAVLMSNKIQNEWQQIMKEEMAKMEEGKSEINSYGLTNEAEFFAVVSEYFFEKPYEMLSKHSSLYNLLCKIFKQDTYSMYKSVLYSFIKPYGNSIGRNAPCPCGSGKKYKHCCLNRKN